MRPGGGVCWTNNSVCPSGPVVGAPGGAHVEFTRINITPTIVYKKFEDFLNVAAFSLLVEEFELRRSPSVSSGRWTLQHISQSGPSF